MPNALSRPCLLINSPCISASYNCSSMASAQGVASKPSAESDSMSPLVVSVPSLPPLKRLVGAHLSCKRSLLYFFLLSPQEHDDDSASDVIRGWRRLPPDASDSEAGPYAAHVWAPRPTLLELCRLSQRLRMPPPFAPAACRCGGGLDVPSNLAACLRTGVLRFCGGPLARAAARVCRKAGATVQQHDLIRDLNVEPGRPDGCRIEDTCKSWNKTSKVLESRFS